MNYSTIYHKYYVLKKNNVPYFLCFITKFPFHVFSNILIPYDIQDFQTIIRRIFIFFGARFFHDFIFISNFESSKFSNFQSFKVPKCHISKFSTFKSSKVSNIQKFKFLKFPSVNIDINKLKKSWTFLPRWPPPGIYKWLFQHVLKSRKWLSRWPPARICQ